MKKILILFSCLVCVAFSAEFDSSKIGAYQKECAANVAQGCFFVGVAYFLGDGFTKDDTKAMEFFKKANKLDKKNAVYIATIARMYYYGYKTDGVAALNDAVKLFDAACKLKDNNSCYELGEIYNYEVSVHDSLKAASYYKQSCNLQNMDGCLKLRSLKNK
jgi:TPR repeat protein